MTADLVLRADEMLILESACRTLDLLARLDAALESAPLTVGGSAGQEREHPLLSEVRQHRALLAAHLRQLDIRADGATDMSAGRALARQRWGRRAG